MALCEEMSPVPEVSFAGPVDGALDPVRAAQFAQTLRDALAAVTWSASLDAPAAQPAQTPAAASGRGALEVP